MLETINNYKLTKDKLNIVLKRLINLSNYPKNNNKKSKPYKNKKVDKLEMIRYLNHHIGIYFY